MEFYLTFSLAGYNRLEEELRIALAAMGREWCCQRTPHSVLMGVMVEVA